MAESYNPPRWAVKLVMTTWGVKTGAAAWKIPPFLTPFGPPKIDAADGPISRLI